MRLARIALFASSMSLVLVACTSAAATWTYAPAPSASPIPSASASASASAASGNIQISALGTAFEQASVDAPAGAAFKIDFDNKDPGTPHDIVIHTGDKDGAVVFDGAEFKGVMVTTYDVPALPAGTYAFVCSIHANMVGVLNAK